MLICYGMTWTCYDIVSYHTMNRSECEEQEMLCTNRSECEARDVHSMKSRLQDNAIKRQQVHLTSQRPGLRNSLTQQSPRSSHHMLKSAREQAFWPYKGASIGNVTSHVWSINIRPSVLWNNASKALYAYICVCVIHG